MDFREYLTTHASKQIDKINALIANDEWNEEQHFQILLGKHNPALLAQRGTISVPRMGKAALGAATGVKAGGSPKASASPMNSSRASQPGSSRNSVGGKKK